MAERLVMTRLLRRVDDDGSFDHAFWRAVGHEGRFRAAWEMIGEVAAMRRESGDESRLQKSVAVLRRRAG